MELFFVFFQGKHMFERYSVQMSDMQPAIFRIIKQFLIIFKSMPDLGPVQGERSCF